MCVCVCVSANEFISGTLGLLFYIRMISMCFELRRPLETKPAFGWTGR